jgi:peptide/nickel transport system permease protein
MSSPMPVADSDVTASASSRRKQDLTDLIKLFVREPSGVIGLAVLVIVIALALLAPVITDPSDLDVTKATGGALEPPSSEFLLGTDETGRSVALLTLWGARISLLVGLLASLMSMVLGTGFGIAAGHFRGVTAQLLQRLIDWFLVLPSLPLALALAAVLDRSLMTIVIAIGVTSWAGTARVIRSQAMTVDTRPYLERARALGGGHVHQMARHILPSVMPLVLANTTLTVASAILAESTLAFLGLGDPTRISWGSMLRAARASGAATAGAWWYLLPPGIAIVIVVLSFTLVSRALESALNPRLRGDG